MVLVGSINGRLAEDVHVAYDASKGAVEAMVRSLAVSLAPRGIRVNGMAPGLVETPLTAGALADPKFRAGHERRTPLGRIMTVEDLMGAIVFLAAPASAMISGTSLVIDGGFLTQ